MSDYHEGLEEGIKIGRAEAQDRIEAQAARIERLDARIVELKAEAKLWWDENFKKQTACEQMGKRIAELEAVVADLDAQVAAFIRGNLTGGK